MVERDRTASPAGVLGRLRRGATGQRGASSVEFVGILAIVAALVGVVGVAVAAQGSSIVPAARAAICAVVGGTACDAPGDGDVLAGPDGTDGAGAPDEAGATDRSGCDGFWGCVWEGTKQVGSGIFNVGRGAWDDVVGIYDLIRDPGRLVDAAEYIWNNPGDALRQMVWDDESAGMWESGDYGGAIGRTLWNVGSWFIPGYDVAKAGSLFGDLGRVARLGGNAARVVDDVADIARRAQQAASRGNLDEAAALAADAERRADDLADAARRTGCLGAGLVTPDGSRILALGGGGPGSAAATVVVAAGPCDVNRTAVENARRQAQAARAAAESAVTGPVAYGQTALGQAVLDRRILDNNVRNNYAAALLDDGTIITGRSDSALHAEQDVLAQAGDRRVVSLYTERQPCAARCQAATEGINVQYTFPWEPSSVRPPNSEITATVRQAMNERRAQQP